MQARTRTRLCIGRALAEHIACLSIHLGLPLQRYPDDHGDGVFFTNMVERALQWDLSEEDFSGMRQEEMEKVQAKLARIKQMQEEESDDEIVFSDESDEE